MPTIFTCGGPSIRTEFTYEGDLENGVTINFASGMITVDSTFLQAIIENFRGKKVKGGFSATNPTPGGLGKWIEDNSGELNTTKLTPRHGSFVAAILQDLGYLDSSLDRNAVILKFRA
jgi:hypothetical protein